MSFHKFELAKQNNPGLADLLDRIMQYIEDQKKAGQTFFLPKLAAAAFRLNDGEAFVLMEVLARAGVLKRAFNVYCGRTGVLLATVSNEGALKVVPHCDECDVDHEGGELRLELAFEFPPANDVGRAA